MADKLSDLFDVIYITPRICDEIEVGKAYNSGDVSLFGDMLECGKIKLIGVDEENVMGIRYYVNSSSREAELLSALIREPTLVLLIDNSDVFWFMRQKDLTYLTTANIVITLFANPGIWHIPNRKHVCTICWGARRRVWLIWQYRHLKRYWRRENERYDRNNHSIERRYRYGD